MSVAKGRFVLAIDQGTSSTKAVLLDLDGRVTSYAQKAHRQISPQPGWAEHDLDEIWQAMLESSGNCLRLAGAMPADVIAVGLSNQGETTAAWSQSTGCPLHNAIVWHCKRTTSAAAAISRDAAASACIRDRTGLVPDPYFSATKMKWLLDNVNAVKEARAAGDLRLGTLDTWMTWRMTGGRRYVTDPSTASRTMLFNIHERRWDPDLGYLCGVPLELLAEIIPSAGADGVPVTDPAAFLGIEAPIAASLVDQQAALFGHGCLQEGDAKITYGTGCFLLQNTGPRPVLSQHGLLTTVAWMTGGKTTFALDGGVYSAGSLVHWLVDSLGLAATPDELGRMAESVPDSGDVYLVPALSGLGAPHWDPRAAGAIVGLNLSTEKSHLARAALEGIAFRVSEVVDAMADDAGRRPLELRVDGGLTRGRFLMQFQADIAGIPVRVAPFSNMTALGAGILALRGLGLATDPGAELGAASGRAKVYLPSMLDSRRQELLEGWARALERAKGWRRED